MRNKILILLVVLSSSFFANAQIKGVKIGYIDMEYILQNVPEYAEANNQLENKAQKWKQEIEVKKNEVAKRKESLKTEQVLLTRELIDERLEEIKTLETELLEYSQKRFGPNGDLIIQKSVLVKPIQDQIFTAVQDLSEAKKYDFIFDKSSDLTMLFAAKRFDISDQVIRALSRATRKEQLSKKQLKEEADKDAKEDLIKENPELVEKIKLQEDKKEARQKAIEDKKAAAEAKKKEAEDARLRALEEKAAKRAGIISDTQKTTSDSTAINPKEAAMKLLEENKKIKAAEKAKILEEHKKALEDKKKKILEDREAARKAKEEKLKEKQIKTNTN
jgi:Skp family chaperone for outer membrane proteins